MHSKSRIALAASAALLVTLTLIPRSSLAGRKERKRDYPQTPAAWTGHNRNLAKYQLAPGYPAYAAHPRYLGELQGSWREMGRQYGEKAGDLIKLTFEGWYKELRPVQGSDQAIIDYVHHEDSYYSALVPEALEMMKGIAEGAKEDLDSSSYANTMPNYEKILMINSYFGLQGKPPGVKPVASEGPACSGAVIFGAATKDHQLIHVSSEDQHFFPQEYLVTFVVNPTDRHAHRFTVTDTAGELGSEHALNDAGVTVSGYAGGGVDIASPTAAAPFSG